MRLKIHKKKKSAFSKNRLLITHQDNLKPYLCSVEAEINKVFSTFCHDVSVMNLHRLKHIRNCNKSKSTEKHV
jgi:hypothetical protein